MCEHYYLGMEPYCVIDDVQMYDTTEIGDRVYLLFSGKGKVLHLFNQNEWILDTSEFTHIEEGYYFPKL